MTANAFFPTLFSPIDIGGVTLRNRIIHAAIVTHYVANGAPTEKLLNYYRARAAGDAPHILYQPADSPDCRQSPDSTVSPTQKMGSQGQSTQNAGLLFLIMILWNSY